ncbi:MAG: elongation factor P 5-aminopentanone reductase [Hominimerdicola sp.]
MVKTAFVTGGSGGIGGEICRQLAENGWLVAVGYNTGKAQAENIVWNITQSGYTAKAFYCDISSLESIQQCIDSIRLCFGEINLLVNNAGTADIRLFTDLDDNKMLELVNVNLIGAMRLSKLVLPQMIREKQGNIINISSVWGEQGASCEVAYSTAKAGLIGFTKALARETAPSGVRVNCVSCGLIDTKMNSELSHEDLQAVIDEIPASRIGTPADVASAVMFLAGESSSYITGQVLRVDGCWI